MSRIFIGRKAGLNNRRNKWNAYLETIIRLLYQDFGLFEQLVFTGYVPESGLAGRYYIAFLTQGIKHMQVADLIGKYADQQRFGWRKGIMFYGILYQQLQGKWWQLKRIIGFIHLYLYVNSLPESGLQQMHIGFNKMQFVLKGSKQALVGME
jgi:hypothetical protein